MTKVSKDPRPAPSKCVVFTHFRPGRHFDAAAGKLDERALIGEWTQRFECYQGCSDRVRRVFVFISEGYHALLKDWSSAPFLQLSLDRQLVACVEKAAGAAGCDPRFVVPIGFDRLVDILRRLQLRAAADVDLGWLLLGSGREMRYDAPKIVDAILRVAGRRTGTPVFRFDEDVEPNVGGIGRLLDAFEALPDRDGVYVFSGGYGGWSGRDKEQRALLNNFAVRTHHLANRTPQDGWTLERQACERFLNELSGLGAEQGFDTKLGDSSSAQVVSGAGLCLSYEAIKKLPPFANLNYAITWIDDHIKRKMHEGLDDLKENAATSRIEGVLFRQDRHPQLPLKASDMGGEGIRYYLRALARGCILDALIFSGDQPGAYTQELGRWSHGKRRRPSILKDDPAATLLTPDGRELLVSDGRRRLVDRLEELARWYRYQKKPDEMLTAFGAQLVRIGTERLNRIKKAWNGTLSKEALRLDDGSSFCPVDVDAYLDERLVYQVVGDLARYLELLDRWPTIVTLLEAITETDDDWWFDRDDTEV